MEPFEKDEMPDEQLQAMLREWRAPQAPHRLRQRVLGRPERPWFVRFWSASVRVPVPLGCGLAALLALAVWLWLRPAAPPVTIVRTVRVEVPVIQERVVTKTVYRDRKPQPPIAWRPVEEIRPKVFNDEQEPK